ncbi:MAG: ribokinase [Pseudomonadota bacterium]
MNNNITPCITVVGSINMDLVFRTPRMPMLGETITGTGFQQVPGGKGANQAVAAARQGAEVHFVGAVGDDGFGDHAVRCLAAEGIGVADIVSATGKPSGVAGIFVDGNGANSIVLAPGANAQLSPEHVERAVATIASAAFLICQLESPLASVMRAIHIARANEVQVVFNPAPAQAIPNGLLALVDYLIVNQTEAAQLSGIEVSDTDSAARAAEALRAHGASAVLVTMGEHGVLVAAPGHQRFLAAVKVDVVDTTAAGDTFVGVFTVGMARGMSIDDAVIEAQFAAACAVTRMGAQTSIPTREEVLQMMRSKQPRGVP